MKLKPRGKWSYCSSCEMCNGTSTIDDERIENVEGDLILVESWHRCPCSEFVWDEVKHE